MSSIGDHSTTQDLLTGVAIERKIDSKEAAINDMSKDKRNQPLGEYIKERRLSLGLSVVAASAAAGLDHTFWRKLEAGQYASPSPKALAPIGRVVGAPLEDLYGLAGFEASDGLPSFAPYLRSRYDLPPEAVVQLESYFKFLRDQYGIPANRAVFPSKATEALDAASRPDVAPADPDAPHTDEPHLRAA